jgi:ABC-type transporter Mla MlaB component/rubrerythrin
MFYLGSIDLHIYDNWFGFIYNGILAISSRIYYVLVSSHYMLFSTCVILFILYPFFKLIINTGVTFSRQEGGLMDTIDRSIKAEFWFKAFIAGMLIILMISEVDVTLINSNKSVNSVIPLQVSDILIKDGLGFKDSDNYMRCEEVDSESNKSIKRNQCTYAQPVIIALPLFFIDTIYNYIVGPMAHQFKLSAADNVSAGDYAQVNVDVFDKFISGMLNANAQVSIFDNLGTMVSKMVTIGHPIVFPTHHEHDFYDESDTLIPKTQETFKIPKSSGISGFFSNIFNNKPDDESTSRESATLYTILAKFNYLMLYTKDFNSIYKDIEQETQAGTELNNQNLMELKEDLTKFLTGESLDPSSYFTFESGANKGNNKLRALVPNNFVEEKGFNFNKYATYNNLLLTHPELVELFLIALSWYKQLVLPVSELEELSKVIKQCSDEKRDIFDKFACKWNYSKDIEKNLETLTESTPSSILSSATNVSLESKGLKITDKNGKEFETSFYYWNADKDMYSGVMESYLYDSTSNFNSISEIASDFQNSDNDRLIIEGIQNDKKNKAYKYLLFLRSMLSNPATKSIYGFALTQVFMNQSLPANLFNTGKKEMDYKKDYFTGLIELLDNQADRVLKIAKLTDKYLVELKSLNNLIVAGQTEGAVSDNTLDIKLDVIKRIDSAGMSYLLQTIRYWEEVNKVAKDMHGSLSSMKIFLDTLIGNDTGGEGTSYTNDSLGDFVSPLQISKSSNVITQDTDNMLFYFMKVLLDISEVDRTDTNQAFWTSMTSAVKGLGDLTIVTLLKGLIWFLYFILVCVTIFLLFYFLVQRLIAFAIFFLLWPVMFFKAALLGSFKETLGGFFSSWASFRCFDFAFFIGFIFVMFMAKFNTVTAIYATRIFDNYGNDAIRTVCMFIAVISMLVSILVIQFTYTRLAQLLTNKFDVISDSLGKVADMALAQSGAIASIGASGVRTLGGIAGGLLSLIPIAGSVIGAGVQMGSNVAAGASKHVSDMLNKPPEG